MWERIGEWKNTGQVRFIKKSDESCELTLQQKWKAKREWRYGGCFSWKHTEERTEWRDVPKVDWRFSYSDY